MKINEKVAYIKGLAEGLEFDKTTKEGKIINQILEALEIISDDIEELKVQNNELEEYLTDLDDDLSSLEDVVYDEDEKDGEESCGGGCCHHLHEDFDDGVEISCPGCGEKMVLDAGVDLENLKCPGCGENITVTTVSECDCGHDHE